MYTLHCHMHTCAYELFSFWRLGSSHKNYSLLKQVPNNIQPSYLDLGERILHAYSSFNMTHLYFSLLFKQTKL